MPSTTSNKKGSLRLAFISHAKADAKKAVQIAALLEERGVRCWIAPRDVKPGRAYGDEIIRGIESAQAFVLVLSKAANDSAFVAREVERAASKKKPILAFRVANVEPSASLELFISGTQWIDAFSGKLAPHVARLAALLGDEYDNAQTTDQGLGMDDTGSRLRRWMWPAAAAALLLVAVGGVLALWPNREASPPEKPSIGRALLTTPLQPKSLRDQGHEQVAAAEPSGDDAPLGGSRPPAHYDFSGDRDLNSSLMTATQMLPAYDPDFSLCEESSGSDGIAACDRAIASGKFSWRGVSYLYTHRGFLRMQTGALDAAVNDFNQALTSDSANLYAYWNRGAVHAVRGEFALAQEDFNKALALNPNQTSREKIVEALNAVTEGANAANKQGSDPSVLSDPSVFGKEQEGSASAAATYLDAMPAAPAAETAPPAMPAETPSPNE